MLGHQLRGRNRVGRVARRGWLPLFLAMIAGNATWGQDQDDEAFLPGLVAVATHPGVDRVSARRVAPTVAWDWSNGSPDLRLPSKGFRVALDGFLLVQSPGPHRFHCRSDGQVRLWLGETEALVGLGEQSGNPVPLAAGFARFRLEYEQRGQPSRLALDWEGPGFAREPIPGRLLFHGADQERRDSFEEGRRLADRLGCANCHDLPELVKHPGLGPPLRNPGAWTKPGWLDDWLHAPKPRQAWSRMPRFGKGLSNQAAADLIAFLGKTGPGVTSSGELKMALNVGAVDRGRLLFRSIGCLACHFHEERGEFVQTSTTDLIGLTDLWRKRSAAQVAGFLEHPRGTRSPSMHRPDPRLSAEEAAHLAVYLVDRPPVRESPMPPRSREGNEERGRRLAVELRCAACHRIDGLTAPLPGFARLREAHHDEGCLGDEPSEGTSPFFDLAQDQRDALRIYLAGRREPNLSAATATRGDDVITRRNCLGCHARDGRGGQGLALALTSHLSNDPELGALKGTLTPPNLTAVGDKLLPDYLLAAINGDAPSARPWLSVRMPSFDFEPGEAEAIASRFGRSDRMVLEEPVPRSTGRDVRAAESPGTLDLGARLLGQKGFGCLSCHVVAGRIPPGGEPETLGPDLALARDRMSHRFFRRWISDPQRIIAGTPMPQFLKPIVDSGLPPSLDEQLDAIWSLVRSPGLGQAVALGTREVVRQQGERPALVRDMVLLPDAPGSSYTPRGLAMGLKNGVSLLFDADRLVWLASWRGGFLSRTKSGRLWEWHPEGEQIWATSAALPCVALDLDPTGALTWPTARRERFGSFGSVEFQGDALRISYSLHDGADRRVDVQETIRPWKSGWERNVVLSGARPDSHPALVESIPGKAIASENGSTARWSTGTTRVGFEFEEGGAREVVRKGEQWVWPLRSEGAGRFISRVRLFIDEP